MVLANNMCLACGYADLQEPPLKEGTGSSFEICPSCGIQFGYDDEAGGDASARQKIYADWRRLWIDSGMTWWSKAQVKPRDWDPVQQLKNVAADGSKRSC